MLRKSAQRSPQPHTSIAHKLQAFKAVLKQVILHPAESFKQVPMARNEGWEPVLWCSCVSAHQPGDFHLHNTPPSVYIHAWYTWYFTAWIQMQQGILCFCYDTRQIIMAIYESSVASLNGRELWVVQIQNRLLDVFGGVEKFGCCCLMPACSAHPLPQCSRKPLT